MKVYLDDERSVPEGWVLCKTAHEAIDKLRTGEVTDLDLDYYLGEGEFTGMHVIQYLEMRIYAGKEYNSMPNITVHSSLKEYNDAMLEKVNELLEYIKNNA